MKAIIAVLVFSALSVPAFAADLHCVSAADSETPITLDVTVNAAGDAVENAAFEIQGDMSYTTTAEQEANRSTIVPGIADQEQIRFKMHYAYQDYDSDVAEIWLVRLWEVSQSAVGGVISVAGGGVWPVTCTEAS